MGDVFKADDVSDLRDWPLPGTNRPKLAAGAREPCTARNEWCRGSGCRKRDRRNLLDRRKWPVAGQMAAGEQEA